ncbi:hypothetical protein BSL78_14080 [Apostichopus japonicus]|uniref:Polyhydroxybutyrate depolymerase n=1 Tax=Stichopus japonicus TaxID=307972 RepID=A0A2G8KM83_STIJA|nr:hypothetical protein BSL78_14080 [Apostichopus japonicus]
MQVAHSKTFMGAGVVAGGPYYCAQASALRATGECMDTGNINVGYLQQVTRNTVLTGTIDAVSNMYNHRVYLFSGTSDTVVQQPVMEALDLYLQEFVNPANIKKQFSMNAGHAFITDNFGNSCSANADPFISDCNSNEAYNILNHIYGGLVKPSSFSPPALTGDFYEFNQAEFISFPNSYSVDDTGYAYVPSGCSSSSSNCKVHVVLHGCLQGKESVGTECALNIGYNEVAELNDIIVIYPQAIVRSVIGNPNGCWDWWGYTGVNYASKLGDQMKAIKGMVDRVLS